MFLRLAQSFDRLRMFGPVLESAEREGHIRRYFMERRKQVLAEIASLAGVQVEGSDAHVLQAQRKRRHGAYASA